MNPGGWNAQVGLKIETTFPEKDMYSMFEDLKAKGRSHVCRELKDEYNQEERHMWWGVEVRGRENGSAPVWEAVWFWEGFRIAERGI